MAAALFRCGQCGRQIPARQSVCPSCGASLLVDVVVDKPVGDQKRAYMAAREIDALGGAAPTFDEVKHAFTAVPGVFLGECSRDLAQTVGGILRRHGIEAREVPVRRVRSRPAESVDRAKPGGDYTGGLRSMWRRMPVAGRIVFAVAIGLTVVVLWSRSNVTESSGENPTRRSSSLSSREIVARSLPASVQVISGNRSAVGFFVSEDRLLTSSKVAESAGATVQIVSSDGRVHRGEVEHLDRRLGVAQVVASEVGGSPLPVGDATVLERGEAVVVVGNPSGDGLSVRQAIVSETSRVLMGLTFFRLDQNHSATSIGGPVINHQGRVVAVVMSDEVGDGGLALPVNYLCSRDEVWFPEIADPGVSSRWEETLSRVAETDREQLESLLEEAKGAALIRASSSGGGGVEAVVARLAHSNPEPERLEFQMLGATGSSCDRYGEVSWWQPVVERRGLVEDSRFLSWLHRHGKLSGVYVGDCRIDVRGCATTSDGAHLVLRRSLPVVGAVPVEAGGRR